MKRINGSITVFICIILSVLIPLCGILMDMARYNEAFKVAESSLKICTESMLAAYDRQLKEQFGLFAMYPRDVASIEKEIYELLSDNLTPENAEGDVTDLYHFKVNRVEVIPIYNLSEPYVLEQQVTEFMKYRAPIQAVSEFLEKLKSMTGLAKEGEMVERNMSLDKLLNKLREDMLYFALLMDQKMESINVTETETLSSIKIKAIQQNSVFEEKHLPDQQAIDNINKSMDEYRKTKIEYDTAKTAYENAEKAFEQVYDNMQSRKEQLDHAKKSRDSSEGDGDEDDEKQDQTGSSQMDGIIKALEDEIANLQHEYDNLKSARDSARNYYDQMVKKLNGNIQTLNHLLSQILTCYEVINSYTRASAECLVHLKEHLALHLAYNTKAIELGKGIIPQAQEIQNEKKNLENAMGDNSDSAISQQIGADLEKKLLSIDSDHIGQVVGQLENNKARLEQWLDGVRTAYDVYLLAINRLNEEIEFIGGLIGDKGDGSQVVSMYTGHDDIPAAFQNMVASFDGLEDYLTMKAAGTYIIPDYELTPSAVEKELMGFELWHGSTFEGANEAQQEEVENPDLQNARDKAGKAAGDMAEGLDESEEGDNNTKQGSINSLDDFFTILEAVTVPSRRGIVSSEESLAAISEHVWQTQQDQSILHNPLDDPVQGVDTVNEKDKGFFDHELERISKFFSTIGDLLKDAGESIIKSLYMNEYIVSAFKNHTTKNNILEYDIGWNRPLDSTFFDQGEVEYVIFGNNDEPSNIAAAKRSIIAIRLIFNLLHVYTDPEKLATTFQIASGIAGWTLFGVPIVQNFLLVSWAALESWVDTERLMAGGQVPLIKTKKSWFLHPDRLKDYLINNVIDRVKDIVVDKAEEWIDDGAAYLEETIMAFINGQVDGIFSKIEEGWSYVAEEVAKVTTDHVKEVDLEGITDITGDTVESFLESLREYLIIKISDYCQQIEKEGDLVIAKCKMEVKEKIYGLIFESEVYNNLKKKVKGFAKEAIDKGFDAVSSKISGTLGSSGGQSSGAKNVLGRLIMMDYTDYLRLMLLTVTPEQKALRCADLIQLDMFVTAPDSFKPISQYHTALYVKAWIDIRLWVIPEAFYKKDKEGMIVVEWTQGY